MKEQKLIDELNRFDSDESYARRLCEVPAEGELCEQDLRYFECAKKEVREGIVKKLFYVQRWNKNPSSGVPARFSDASFFNFKCSSGQEQERLEKVIRFVEKENNDGILLMTGSKGTGKTHLGVAAVRDVCGFYVGMEDLIYKVESSMNFKSPQTEEEVFEDFSKKPFLVIDEIGRSLKREKETEILSYILRKRYDNMLPTILISNLDKTTLLKSLGGAVVDRLCEVGEYIEFTGDSYRMKKREERTAA
mgnify:CR=1 FL=1